MVSGLYILLEGQSLRRRSLVNEKIPRHAKMIYHTLSGMPDVVRIAWLQARADIP